MTRPATPLVLLQMSLARGAAAPQIDADCRQACAAAPLAQPMQLRRVAWSEAAAMVYAYLEPQQALAAPDFAALRASCAAHCSWAGEVRTSPLEPVFDIAGASSAAPAAFHYVVEMDPDPGWMPELARWYDTEHMPGLAGVPGCVRASRFLNHGHGPLSLACYDLVSTDTLGSPPWLAVRATPWSDIARPHFTNTKRTMFRIPLPD